MEWLENLLKEAKITDGKLDVPALMAAVKKEFPNHAVSKQEFNEALEAKKLAMQKSSRDRLRSSRRRTSRHRRNMMKT